MLKNLFHIMLYTENKDRLVDFYNNTLGLDLKNPNDEISRLYLQNGSTTIGFIQKSQTSESGKRFEISFQVDSVKESVKLLKEKGVSFTRDAIKIGEGLFVANFNDPDGNQLSILSFGND